MDKNGNGNGNYNRKEAMNRIMGRVGKIGKRPKPTPKGMEPADAGVEEKPMTHEELEELKVDPKKMYFLYLDDENKQLVLYVDLYGGIRYGKKYTKKQADTHFWRVFGTKAAQFVSDALINSNAAEFMQLRLAMEQLLDDNAVLDGDSYSDAISYIIENGRYKTYEERQKEEDLPNQG